MKPRNEAEAREKLLADCKRPAFARLARYTKDIEGEAVTRASIKFVEAALARWGNVRTDSVISSDTEKARTVRVIVTDLESGAEYSKEILLEKIVERRKVAGTDVLLGTRQTAAGQVHLVRATEDDLAAKEAELASVVVRQLGLRILPADLVAECMDVVAATVGDSPQARMLAAHDEAEAIGAKVHPQESRSSALAGLLAKRKGKPSTKDAAPQQTATQARETVPCAHCALPIFQVWEPGKNKNREVWQHTNGSRRCADRFHCAKPRQVQA